MRRNRKTRTGFTLIEAAMTTVIIGLGVVSMMRLLAAGTVSNLEGTELTTGINLAKSIRELGLQKSMAEVIAMNGVSHQPPWDSSGAAISSMSNWKQTIAVSAVDPNRLTTTIIDSTPAVVRVTVTVTHNNRTVGSASWFTFDGRPPG